MEKKRHLKIASSSKGGSNKTTLKKAPSNCIDGLKILQADVYALYLKTQNYHWNVVGPHFSSLHKLFDEQYHELAEAIDTIAERIRALDATPPASFDEFLALKTISEGKSHFDAMKMIQDLIQSHTTVCDLMHDIVTFATEEADDATLNLVGERLEVHEKMIWMLKANLEK